jgi:hypothetical protein
VAEVLLDLYTRRSCDTGDPTDVVPETVQESTFEKITAKRNRIATSNVPADHALMLKHSVNNRNDPVDSFLLGATIWYELIPVDMFSNGESEFVARGPLPESEYIFPSFAIIPRGSTYGFSYTSR